jgi:hypothetical protein
VHQKNIALAIGMRMGIFITGPAMGRPARMRNAQKTGNFPSINFLFQFRNLSDCFKSKNIFALKDGEAGTVITAVFQPF